MKILLYSLCFLSMMVFVPIWAQDEPDVILHNGKIVTVDERFSIEEAVAIRGKLVLAVGSNQDIRALQGDSTHAVDLEGRTVIPGLIDNHVHITVPFITRVSLGALTQMNRQIALNFRNCVMGGVTTVRDVGAFPGKLRKFRAMADALRDYFNAQGLKPVFVVVGRGGPNLIRGMAYLKDILDALGLPYRVFGHDSAMSGVVNYVKDIDTWMRAGGRAQVAQKMGIEP